MPNKVKYQNRKFPTLPAICYKTLSKKKNRKVTLSNVMLPFVPPHGKVRLPPVGFSWKFILDTFTEICFLPSIGLLQYEDDIYFAQRPTYVSDDISL